MKRDNITEEAFDLREKSSLEYDKDKFHYVIEDANDEQIKRLVIKL